jgi:DNA integrity scanning protein DisA with diadenylate cyclase activity
MFAVAALNRGPINETPLMVFALAGTTIPAAIGIAILRYRLYDIDRIISRTIAYAIVSAITAIVFGGAIVLLTTVLARFAEGQTIAVAAATLTAFVAFQPLLRRVRRNVDRRFDRVSYDAEQTVAGFSTRLRDEVDISTVATDLCSTVQGAVNPSSVGLWIRVARP